MCYHISFEIKLESIVDYFPDAIIEPQLQINFPKAAYVNGFDHALQPCMFTVNGNQHLKRMMWGFLPNGIKNYEQAERFWNGYKNENGKWQKGFVTLNAMGEELLDKKLYRDAALNRRCIVFVDGFYEWHHHFPLGKKGQPLKTAVKYPHHIFLKNNPEPFMMFAAVWNNWVHSEVDKETGEVQTFDTSTFAIVTTRANRLMSKIHNSKQRMPTLLTKELAEEWISSGLSEKRISELATFQYPAEQMSAYTIKKNFQEDILPKSEYAYAEMNLDFC